MNVRAATVKDQDSIGRIAEAAGLFPAEYVPEMIAPALNGEAEAWRVYESGSAITAFAFARPEELTDRTWNILALAVDQTTQRNGIASTLLTHLEAELGARVIIIETTQLPEQKAARTFYETRGYAKQGHVKDFYGQGEDKIIYSKVLS